MAQSRALVHAMVPQVPQLPAGVQPRASLWPWSCRGLPAHILAVTATTRGASCTLPSNTCCSGSAVRSSLRSLPPPSHIWQGWDLHGAARGTGDQRDLLGAALWRAGR